MNNTNMPEAPTTGVKVNHSSSRIRRRPKVVLYGFPATGKTTLASKVKDTLLIDLEGGAEYVDIDKTDVINSLEEFYKVIADIYRDPNFSYKYIAIDSVTKLLRLTVEAVCGIDRDNLSSTLNNSHGGYGNGALVFQNHFETKILKSLNVLNQAKNIGIILISHASQNSLVSQDGIIEKSISLLQNNKSDVSINDSIYQWCDVLTYLTSIDNEFRVSSLPNNISRAKSRIGKLLTITDPDKYAKVLSSFDNVKLTPKTKEAK